ncbi:MAG TPA: hypothetical protein VK171_00925, partial [Fimbriimonas sp.]|nr:hypothetical protein [Fimbriimonas sp.]
NWFQWLMAPTALAAVVALTFVVTRSGNFEDRSQITASNFGAGESPLVGTKSVEDPFSTPEASNPFSATVETTTPVKETIVAAKTTSEPRKRIRRPRSSSNQPLLVAATTPTLPGGAAFDMGTPHASAARAVAMKADAPGAAGAMFVADVPQDDRTIIVIDKEQESGVGAVVATEVSVSQDVIIGG